MNKENIKFAFIFGSFANNNYTENSDIDLFVIGDVKLQDLMKEIKSLEQKIQRQINPVIWSFNVFNSKHNSSFIKTIFKNNIILLKGNENELRLFVS